MQTVSQAWKDNHRRTLVSEGFVEVSLNITDPEVQGDASSQDNGAAYISNTAQVVSEVDRNIVPYSTLEQNLWVLDGSRKTIPVEGVGDCGFVGDVLSGVNCGYSSKIPLITINFSQVNANLIPAVTITWSEAFGEYAEDFVVTAYNGNTVVAHKEVLGNKSVRSVVRMALIDYDRITIAVHRWCLPYRRARVEEIFVGMNMVYTKSELFGYTHSQTVDPISTSLPKTEISFSVGNVDDVYNPYNKDGLTAYLMERQAVKTRYGYKMDNGSVEWIKGGTFYLTEWYADQNGLTADFKARDLIDFLSDEHNDAVSSITSRTLYDLAVGIFNSVDLPVNSDGSVKWYVDESLREVTTTAPLPKDTKANCLQLIANAGCCVFYQDRNGTLRIEPMRAVSSQLGIGKLGEMVLTESDYAITMFNSYSKPEMSIAKPIKNVVLKVYTYTMGENGIEDSVTEIVSDLAKSGDSLVVDNPLITDSNRAIIVGAWMCDYVRGRISLKCSWRPDVRLDALDIITVDNDYGNNTMVVTDVSYSFNGAFKGTSEGRVL